MTTVWRLWPFAFLMILAGMQNIPQELYEAAAVDGASPLRRLRYITLPLLRPVTGVLHLILFLWTFNEFNTRVRALRARAAEVGRPAVAAHLRELVREPTTSGSARRCR